MKYKLLHEDDHLMHIRHPNGQTFAIAKKAVGSEVVKKVQSFAEGGEVEDDGVDADLVGAEAPAETIEPDPPVAPAADIGNVASLVPPTAEPAAAPGWQAPMLTPEQQAVQAQAEPQATDGLTTTPATPSPFEGLPGYSEVAKDIENLGKAKSAESGEMVGALQQYNQDLQKQQADTHEQLAKIDADNEKLKTDIMTSKIDPQRLFHSRSEGDKISAVIGMVLSGIGSGLTGQPNMAMQLMDKAVDRDIEAQKAAINNKNTLYSMNLQKYHNIQAADAATRMQMNVALQTKLQIAQARAQSPAAVAAAHQTLLGLQNQAMQFRALMQKTLGENQSLGVGTGEGGIPVGKEPAALLQDPKYRESRVVVGSKAYQARDKAAATNLAGMETLAGPIMEDVRKLQQLAGSAKTKFAGTAQNSLAHGIMDRLAVRMALMTGATIGAKRISETDVQAQKKAFQDPTRFDQALAGIKNNEFFNSIGRELEAARTQNLIGYKGSDSIPFQQLDEGKKLPLNK